MSIFSRIKKAKKAAEEHKKAATAQVEEVKPPLAPYRHVPVHAAQDALAATPTIWGPEETRARIAAARKRRSEMIASAPMTTLRPSYRTYSHSCANNKVNLATHPAYRPRKDLSIETVIQQPQPQLQPCPPRLSARNAQSLLVMHGVSQLPNTAEFNAFSQPREAPVPRPRGQRPYYVRHVPSGSLSVTKKKSPLSAVFMEHTTDDECSYTSQNSTSSTSSRTSSVESPTRHSGSSEWQRLRRLPMPNFISHKRSQQAMEISLPYESNDEYSVASSTIPTWRYEDLTTPTEPPAIVKSLSSTQSRRSSSSMAIFHKREDAILSH